jgi:hypothetical protein
MPTVQLSISSHYRLRSSYSHAMANRDPVLMSRHPFPLLRQNIPQPSKAKALLVLQLHLHKHTLLLCKNRSIAAKVLGRMRQYLKDKRSCLHITPDGNSPLPHVTQIFIAVSRW